MTDPFAFAVTQLTDLANLPDAADYLRRYAAAKVERYQRERDLGWPPAVAWERAEQMTHHYLERP